MIKTIHGILLILYIIVCVALTVVVILQEGKQAGLTGGLVVATRVLAVLFVLISLLLNLSIFS